MLPPTCEKLVPIDPQTLYTITEIALGIESASAIFFLNLLLLIPYPTPPKSILNISIPLPSRIHYIPPQTPNSICKIYLYLLLINLPLLILQVVFFRKSSSSYSNTALWNQLYPHPHPAFFYRYIELKATNGIQERCIQLRISRKTLPK